jgi:hypothetical protein
MGDYLQSIKSNHNLKSDICCFTVFFTLFRQKERSNLSLFLFFNRVKKSYFKKCLFSEVSLVYALKSIIDTHRCGKTYLCDFISDQR